MTTTTTPTPAFTPTKRTYTVEEVAYMLGIGKSKAYALVKEGHFRSVRIGATIRISKQSFDEWLDKQEF